MSDHFKLLTKVVVIMCIFVICNQALKFDTNFQNDNIPEVYKMPKRHSMKLKVFIECRRDCFKKCNHSLFAYLSNESECYTCLIECMSAFTQQAEKIGIQLKDLKKMNRENLLSDSLFAPGKKVRRRHLRQDFYHRESRERNQ